MAWPKEYGGADAPVWTQMQLKDLMEKHREPRGPQYMNLNWIGPSIMLFGTDEQKDYHLSRMTAGDVVWCQGFSEPDSGSDLASVRTRAERTNDGWRIDGTKVWTSNAHRSQYMIALCRTGPAGESRHEGLSQFLIDLEADGVQVSPIVNLAGKHDFNECVFEDVVIPADRLIGQEGDGWRQVTGELALERSGPERILSTFHLFAALVEAAGPEPEPRLAEAIGRLTAEFYSLRAMSLAVAGQLEKGELPEVEAAIVKDMGTRFEAEVVETLRRAVPVEPVAGGSANAPSVEASLGATVLGLPSFTLRGGTNEVLRSIIARGLGVR